MVNLLLNPPSILTYLHVEFSYLESHPGLDNFFKKMLIYAVIVTPRGPYLLDQEAFGIARYIGFTSQFSSLFKHIIQLCLELGFMVRSDFYTSFGITQKGFEFVNDFGGKYLDEKGLTPSLRNQLRAAVAKWDHDFKNEEQTA